MKACKYVAVVLMVSLGLFSNMGSAAKSSIQPTPAGAVAAPIGISANPASVNISVANGTLQQSIDKLFGITNDHGFTYGGLWLADINQLFSGGVQHPDRTTTNSSLQLDFTLDTEKLNGWKNGLFGMQLLQVNAQNTNFEAGTVQGYNGIPGPPPLNRFEMYQLWFRQTFFDEKFIFRIGKTVPTYDFGNVVKPVALHKGDPTIPAVSGAIFTPVYVNSSMLGTLPGYYNSAYGITLSFAPVKTWYLSYGLYDGNLARGEQTGLHGTPTFNGAYFQIAETGFAWLLGKDQRPGTIGFGAWHQHGTVQAPPTISENNTAGAYLFGNQRLWYKNPGRDNSGVSGYYQYGSNKSRAMLMTKYAGAGLTAFGLVPHRFDDSFGIGAAFAWMNTNKFPHQNELVLQAYYQAIVMKGVYLEPVLSYIPTPASNNTNNNAIAGTLRLAVIF